MISTNIDNCLDRAVQQLPPIRRAIYTRLLKKKDVREDVCNVLVTKLQSDTDALACLPIMSEDSFTSLSSFSIDPDNLEKFLAIIVKYLPMILEIIFKLFV